MFSDVSALLQSCNNRSAHAASDRQGSLLGFESMMARPARPPKGRQRDYSSLIFAALITLPQRSISSCMYCRVFSTEPPNGTADIFLRRSCKSG